MNLKRVRTGLGIIVLAIAITFIFGVVAAILQSINPTVGNVFLIVELVVVLAAELLELAGILICGLSGNSKFWLAGAMIVGQIIWSLVFNILALCNVPNIAWSDGITPLFSLANTIFMILGCIDVDRQVGKGKGFAMITLFIQIAFTVVIVALSFWGSAIEVFNPGLYNGLTIGAAIAGLLNLVFYLIVICMTFHRAKQ